MMKILHISDTHNLHNQMTELPCADVIVHSGDFSRCGEASEIVGFINWFCALPYKYKIFVVGNHDVMLWDEATNISGLPSGCYFLRNERVEIEGISFYGVNSYGGVVDVPKVDVLVTHEPPYGVLDLSMEGEHWGSKDLMLAIMKNRPRVHLFGHAHFSFGEERVGDTAYYNSVAVDVNYLLLKKYYHLIEI